MSRRVVFPCFVGLSWSAYANYLISIFLLDEPEKNTSEECSTTGVNNSVADTTSTSEMMITTSALDDHKTFLGT